MKKTWMSAEMKLFDDLITWTRRGKQKTELEQATYELRKLAVFMAKEFYPEVPQWSPLDDAVGLVSQIDNMVTGLKRAERE